MNNDFKSSEVKNLLIKALLLSFTSFQTLKLRNRRHLWEILIKNKICTKKVYKKLHCKIFKILTVYFFASFSLPVSLLWKLKHFYFDIARICRSKMEEPSLNVKIKQEKLTPERETKQDDIEKLLESNLFGENDEKPDKKEIIEPSK